MAARWTMMHKVFAAAVVAVGVAGAAGTPARAEDGWRGHERHEWREHEWREHEWREHHAPGYGYRYYAPRYSYYSGYYYVPPPPPVYVPPPAPSFSVVVPLR